MAVLQVKHAVLLQNRAAHGLDHDARRRVVDLARLLVQLLAEEVDAEVAVLAGGGGARDADHLARVALEHQDVANADVVAGDRDCIGRIPFRVSSCLSTATVALAFPDLDHPVRRRMAASRVGDAVSHLVKAVPERVVVA